MRDTVYFWVPDEVMVWNEMPVDLPHTPTSPTSPYLLSLWSKRSVCCGDLYGSRWIVEMWLWRRLLLTAIGMHCCRGRGYRASGQ